MRASEARAYLQRLRDAMVLFRTDIFEALTPAAQAQARVTLRWVFGEEGKRMLVLLDRLLAAPRMQPVEFESICVLYQAHMQVIAAHFRANKQPPLPMPDSALRQGWDPE